MRESLIALTVAGVATLGLCAPGMAQENADQKLGTVHFATSCNETAQRRFDRAMRYQHSFWYTESKEVYQEALKADPECAIAYWGVALSLLNNPHGLIPAPNLPPGLAAIEKAKATGAKTGRERPLGRHCKRLDVVFFGEAIKNRNAPKTRDGVADGGHQLTTVRAGFHGGILFETDACTPRILPFQIKRP